MANILAILPGMTFPVLCEMSLPDLMRWHDRAEKRNRSEKR